MAGAFTTFLGLFPATIFSALGAKGEVLAGAVLYAHIAFGGAFVFWMSNTMAAILRGTGDTITPARAIITASLTQIPLSGALTVGWGLSLIHI